MSETAQLDLEPEKVVAISPPLAPEQPKELESRKWDWLDDREDVVIPSQPATAVYWNVRGQVIIRQEGQLGDDEDQYVYVMPQNIPALAERLLTEYESWKAGRV